MSAEMATVLGGACAGTPRLARDLVEAYEALSVSMAPTAKDVLDLVGLDVDGLSTKHVSYLKALDALDGVAGEKQLANVLQVNPSILQTLELVLFRRGLITYTARGRALTSKGDARVRGRNVVPHPHRGMKLGTG